MNTTRTFRVMPRLAMIAALISPALSASDQFIAMGHKVAPVINGSEAIQQFLGIGQS